MDTVKVDKQKLREALQKNKAKHVAEYKKAHKKWQKQVVKVLEQRLADAKGGKINLSFHLPEPQSSEKEYDTALEQLDWELMDEVELDRTEFAQFIQDEWRWKAGFVQTASLYQ